MPWAQYSYNVTRPYPGRYTTLFVAIFFIIISVILVLVNIPLSAYMIQQDYINSPNDTNPGPAYFSRIPAFLQHNPGGFVAHTFTPGETFQTNSTIFSPYKIRAAYSRDWGLWAGPKLLSFAYENHDLSTCDVSNITLDLVFPYRAGTVGATATISCWFPVLYQLDVDLLIAFPGQIVPVTGMMSPSRPNSLYDRMISAISGITSDLDSVLQNTSSVTMETLDPIIPAYSQNFTGNLSVMAKQCCDQCWVSWATEGKLEHYEVHGPGLGFPAVLLVDHPSCESSNEDVKFRLSMHSTNDPNKAFLGYVTSPDLAVTLNNTLKALYHAIRLDLGVIQPNEIYNNSTRFNASIADFVPGARAARADGDSYPHVDLANPMFSVHVPDILYLTPLFKLKPLPQAIAAVFVGTFSMLSAVWAVFNLVVSTLVTARSKHAAYCPCPVCESVDLEYAKVPMQDDPSSVENGESTSDAPPGPIHVHDSVSAGLLRKALLVIKKNR